MLPLFLGRGATISFIIPTALLCAPELCGTACDIEPGKMCWGREPWGLRRAAPNGGVPWGVTCGVPSGVLLGVLGSAQDQLEGDRGGGQTAAAGRTQAGTGYVV